VHEDTQLHTAKANISGRGRDPYAEVGRAVRHALTMLHRPLTAEEQSETGLPERASRMAVAVHGAVATGLLASWSRTSTSVRFPLHRIADILGLDPFADSEGGQSKPGNGNRGRQSRHAIGKALDELHTRGALVVVMDTDRYGTDIALLELPPVSEDWSDPTYRDAPETVSERAHPVSDSLRSVSETLRSVSETLTTYEKQDEKQNERASESANERDPDDRLARSHSPDGKQTRGKTARTSEDFGDSQKPAGKSNREGSEAARTSQDITDSQTDSRIRTLAAAVPPAVGSEYPGGALELARAILTHRRLEHRNTLHRLGTWLDVGAVPDLRRFLDEKAKTIRPDVRSWSGLVLAWLQDLPPSPPHESKHYRHGLPFREALRAAEMAGTRGLFTGLVTLSTLANAAETVLDAGHDPATDPDGFLATLAATLLPHAQEPNGWMPDLDVRPLQVIAGTATPVPWSIPHEDTWRDDPGARGTAALDLVGLAGTDPRRSGAAATGWR
jgi:hypothetical protein